MARAELRRAALAARAALDASTRMALDARIGDHLERLLDDTLRRAPSLVLGVYWPIRGEPDLHQRYASWQARWGAAGLTLALPQVLSADAPLCFLAWSADMPLESGAHGIPVPAASHATAVTPDWLLVPCAGFDALHFRLGYGGGYYDRTLARLPARSIGVAYEACRVETIAPQAHDVALDAIVTENGLC